MLCDSVLCCVTVCCVPVCIVTVCCVVLRLRSDHALQKGPPSGGGGGPAVSGPAPPDQVLSHQALLLLAAQPLVPVHCGGRSASSHQPLVPVPPPISPRSQCLLPSAPSRSASSHRPPVPVHCGGRSASSHQPPVPVPPPISPRSRCTVEVGLPPLTRSGGSTSQAASPEQSRSMVYI